MAGVYTGLAGTVLGPLTTVWTLPPTCTYLIPPCSTCVEFFQGQTCGTTASGDPGEPQDNADCWPPRDRNVGTAQWPFVGWGFYSPGLSCPIGYTSACTAVYGEGSEWDVEFILRPKETAVGCCPQYVSQQAIVTFRALSF